MPGIVFLAQGKYLFLFQTWMKTIFINVFMVKRNKISHNNKTKKKWNQNEQILIEKFNNAMDKEDLKNSLSYFPLNELNNSSDNEFNGTNSFHIHLSQLWWPTNSLSKNEY